MRLSGLLGKIRQRRTVMNLIKLKLFVMLCTDDLAYLRKYQIRTNGIDPVWDLVFYLVKKWGFVTVSLIVSLSSMVGLANIVGIIYKMSHQGFTSNRLGDLLGVLLSIFMVTIPVFNVYAWYKAMTLLIRDETNEFYRHLVTLQVDRGSKSLTWLIGTGVERQQHIVPISVIQDVTSSLLEKAKKVLGAVWDSDYYKDYTKRMWESANYLGIVEVDIQKVYSLAKAEVSNPEQVTQTSD